jgi:hypothetical protein
MVNTTCNEIVLGDVYFHAGLHELLAAGDGGDIK